MASSQTDYATTIRFSVRYVLLWTALMVGASVLFALLSGFQDKVTRFGWAAGTIGVSIAVAYLVSHLQRVHALAGRLDAELMAQRHVRTLEFPCPPDATLDMIESVLRAQRTLDSCDVDRRALTLVARLKNLDRYSMDGGSLQRHNLVRANLEALEGVTRATLRFEPACAAWRDPFMLDGGRNLDNALTITAQLESRIAEHRRSERVAAEKAALEQQLTGARLKLLQAQVEPHFLYNTLAHAQLLTRADPAKAEAMLGHLIDFLRSSLPGSGVAAEHSTLGQEVERSRAYLEILKLRMGERLKVEIEVPEALRSTALPPLMLQTLVENAIKHGLEPKPGGGTLWIRAQAEGALARITVADDGVGFQPGSAGTGLGLKNVRDRLALLLGDRATLSVAANFPAGVTATLKVPR